jgi:hypothetical protein
MDKRIRPVDREELQVVTVDYEQIWTAFNARDRSSGAKGIKVPFVDAGGGGDTA